jgi:hypothetical protein
VQVGIGDLLQVCQATHGHVWLQQAAIGKFSRYDRELKDLAGQVEFEETILALRVVGPPDDVESLAAPCPGEPGERPQRVRR